MDEELATSLIMEYFGFELDSIKPLDGYSDRNFFFNAKCSKNNWVREFATDGYVFKIMDSKDSRNDAGIYSKVYYILCNV